MKVQPVSSPHAVAQVQSSETTSKARAIAAFNKLSQAPTQGQLQETPVPNPNQVTAEDLSAIQTTQEPEAQIEPTKEEKPEVKDPALERQFAQLARQERALRIKVQQQDQALKAREALLQAREQELTSTPTFDPKDYIPRSRLKQETLNVLAEEGLSYDEIAQQMISRQPIDPQLQATINRLQAKIDTLEKTAETSQKSYQDQQTQAYQAAVRQIESDAKNLVKSNPVDYEAISKTNSVSDVVELIVKTHEKYGTVLSVEEAAQEVENYLVEEGIKISTNVEKIKRRMQQAAQPTQSQQKPQAQQQTQNSMKTLTNASSSTRKLSSKERAILAFKGELKG